MDKNKCSTEFEIRNKKFLNIDFNDESIFGSEYNSWCCKNLYALKQKYEYRLANCAAGTFRRLQKYC